MLMSIRSALLTKDVPVRHSTNAANPMTVSDLNSDRFFAKLFIGCLVKVCAKLIFDQQLFQRGPLEPLEGGYHSDIAISVRVHWNNLVTLTHCIVEQLSNFGPGLIER